MKSFLLSVCFVFMTTLSCRAATSILYDTSDRVLYISGTGNAVAKNFVTIIVTHSEIDIENSDVNEISDLNNILYKTIETDSNGLFSCEIELPNTFENGKYIVYSYDNDKIGENVFGYLSGNESSALLSQVNNASSGMEMLSSLQRISKDLGLDNQYLNLYGTSIANYIFSHKPQEGYSFETFMKNYYMAEAITCFSENIITMDEMLMLYSAYTGIDYVKDYAVLPESIKQELKKLILTSDDTTEDFAAVYKDKKITATLKKAASFEKLQELFLDYAYANNVDLTLYNGLGNKYYQDMVFMTLYKQIDHATSVSDVIAQFHNAVLEVQAKINSDSNRKTGSSGGGGKNIAIPNVTVPVDISTPVSAKSTQPYTDISSHWAEQDIISMNEAGYINGYEDGTFRPDQNITRAEFVKILSSVLRLDKKEGNQFNDVTADKWFYGYVYAAYDAGLINGVSENEFSPEEYITRQDAVVILQRILKLSGSQALDFEDKDDVALYAQEAVAAFTSHGILNGYNGKVYPKNPLTRAETAVLLNRISKYMKERGIL